MTKDEKNYLCQEIDKVSQDKAIDLLKKNFIVSNIKHTDPTSRHDLELTINNKYDYKIEVKRYLNLYQSYRYSMVEVSKTDYLKQLDGNVRFLLYWQNNGFAEVYNAKNLPIIAKTKCHVPLSTVADEVKYIWKDCYLLDRNKAKKLYF